MPEPLAVLCVHGVGHGDEDRSLVPAWTDAITRNVLRWNPKADVECEFLAYDDLFDHAPLDPLVYARALGSLLASGIVHGVGDLFTATRGLFDVPEQIRWTAGMIAQWASEEPLRAGLRRRLLAKMRERRFTLVCAHSLGSLICYDTFRRNPRAVAGRTFITLGSQIGNPFVRDCFAGRIEPVAARMWFHLFNRDDHVLTARVRLTAGNFAEVLTEFDEAGDVLNHDPVMYFDHVNAQARVWPALARGRAARNVARAFDALDEAAHDRGRPMRNDAGRGSRRPPGPDRRALLVGINDYPNPANRLEGCVNDVFLMSAVLQECGFDPEDIRVVLDDRATAANILERLHWLLDDVRDGAERVLFYSGHGAQIPSYDAFGEVDHLDECLVPFDFDWTPARAIRDKQFVEFYSQLPYGSAFVAIFDCCHSGGMTREGGLRPRGIEPPDDIRHRALRWDADLGMWRERELRTTAGSSAARPAMRDAYLGQNGTTYRFGRGVPLRTLATRRYMSERQALRHRGPYLPVILEACQEAQLSYEYRDGAASYGAFTYTLAKVLRDTRGEGTNPTFRQLTKATQSRLAKLGYDQTPSLVGAKQVISRQIPWGASRASATRRAAGSAAARRSSR